MSRREMGQTDGNIISISHVAFMNECGPRDSKRIAFYFVACNTVKLTSTTRNICFQMKRPLSPDHIDCCVVNLLDRETRHKYKKAQLPLTTPRHASESVAQCVCHLSTRYAKTSPAVSWQKVNDTLMVMMAMFWSLPVRTAGRQRWCRGGSVGRHAGGTVDDVCRLSARYAKTSAAVTCRNKRGRTLVVLMAMFRVW